MTHTTILTSPSIDQVEVALREALDAANRGARTRRVAYSEIEHWAGHVVAESEGILSTDGGSVPNSYRYPAETTDVVTYWWTDGLGRKTVRIHAARAWARKTSYGRGHGTATPRGTAWGLTFPDRRDRAERLRRERLARLLDRFGAEGDDDRLAIAQGNRVLAAVSDEGLLVADHAIRPRIVQVVVRDATTGRRHHITVPPRFGTPTSRTYQKLGSSRARVHAAIAWSFALRPGAYRPTVEA